MIKRGGVHWTKRGKYPGPKKKGGNYKGLLTEGGCLVTRGFRGERKEISEENVPRQNISRLGTNRKPSRLMVGELGE